MEAIKQSLGLASQNLTSNVDLTKLQELKDSIKSDPIMGKVKYHADCCIEKSYVHTKVQRYEIGHESFKHTKTFDIYAGLPKQMLGDDSASTPSELLLSALGSCLCFSFLNAAALKNIQLSNIECKVKGKIDLRGIFEVDDVSSTDVGLRGICAKFSATGVDNEQIDRSVLRELVREAEKRSVVAQTLSKGTRLCTCLKGDVKEFERQIGLTSEEGFSRHEKLLPERRGVPGSEVRPVGFDRRSDQTMGAGFEHVQEFHPPAPLQRDVLGKSEFQEGGLGQTPIEGQWKGQTGQNVTFDEKPGQWKGQSGQNIPFEEKMGKKDDGTGLKRGVGVPETFTR